MTNLDSILKSRDVTLPTKVRLVKAMVFPVVIYGFESWGFPGGSDSEGSARNAHDPSSTSGEGNDHPLQYSCLENSMDRRAWRTTVRGGCKELETTEYAGTHTMPFYIQYLNICGFCVPKGGFLDPTILLPTRALIWSALQCA